MQHKSMTGTLAASVALLAALAAGSAQAAPAVVATGPDGVVIDYAPPAPVYERTPAAREGYVWVPGHYEWRNGRYAWEQGYWLRDRPGFEWREARWIQRPDGSWFLTEGAWVRDERVSRYDEDRWERRAERGPNGDMDDDGVRNRDDRDRDGDGVANRDDDFPNNPNRS